MPRYAYRCNDCRGRFSLFMTYDEYDEAEPTCPRCGSGAIRRRIGRVAIAKSEDARLDALADDSMLDALDEEDPRALGQFMRKMSHEMGEDLGEEFDEVVDRLEKGQSPEDIEAAMPELAESDGMGGDLGGGMVDDF